MGRALGRARPAEWSVEPVTTVGQGGHSALDGPGWGTRGWALYQTPASEMVTTPPAAGQRSLLAGNHTGILG